MFMGTSSGTQVASLYPAGPLLHMMVPLGTQNALSAEPSVSVSTGSAFILWHVVGGIVR